MMASPAHGWLQRLLRCAFLGLTLALTGAAAQSPEYSGTCPSGAQVREAYCRFFIHFNTDSNGPLDTRIADAVGVKTANETRSIGLIIAIDKYPNMPGHDIPAAGVDGDHLVTFLINSQKFDEVIVLRNEDATTDNINYFLEEYLPNRASDFNNKARLLIAYSGHGRYGTPDGTTDTRAAFVLGAASEVDGSENMYKMQEFASDVEALARRYFHVLTLINACYGGSFFTDGSPGGNADAFEKPGSYAITAGSSDDVVPALDPKRGSVFFDLLIQGISQGTADPLYWDAYSVVLGEDASKEQKSGLTRTLALTNYLTSTYARIVRERRPSDPTFILSDPWIGAAQKGIAEGGFFFLSDRSGGSAMDPTVVYNITANGTGSSSGGVTTFGFGHVGPEPSFLGSVLGGDRVSSTSAFASPSSPTATAVPFNLPTSNPAPLSLPPGPISSIVGRPDIKIFKAPEIYPIHGLDFSSADGQIDWQVFASLPRPRFIYARAIGWDGPDNTFVERWSHVKALGIDHGAYLKYDFCRSPEQQLAALSKILPVDPAALPIAIEVVNPEDQNNRQLACLNGMGLVNAKAAILKLASRVRALYGKTPMLYGNRSDLSMFVDQRADEFMVWLGSYGVSGIQLSGRNPWTLWQYSGTLKVKGVGPKTTGDVFFGTEEQYELFKNGQSNVALKAVS